MAKVDDITDALSSFASSCNENERLMSMIKDWNRAIHIQATDIGTSHSLITSLGTVHSEYGEPALPDMVIQSDSETLTAVFYGELSPNEPYNDGSLRIKGSEEDILRLDFIIAMLWE